MHNQNGQISNTHNTPQLISNPRVFHAFLVQGVRVSVRIIFWRVNV